jgi:glycosyltransferase involved in cell wall biosynthesis
MTGRGLTYSIVTPARNEAENLERLAECLAAQTVLPDAWIIVDNGSKDSTLSVARALAERHEWIHVEAFEPRAEMARGAPIVRAFHRGLALVGRPDLVVKLDADVSFGRDFFERLIQEFEADPRLGIAGGLCFELVAGRWVAQHASRSHVRGATRAYRFGCLDQILPLEECMGWDGVDELKAVVRGWRIRTVPDLPFYHHRSLAQRESAWHAWVKQGEMAHFMGYRFSYLVFRALFRSRRDPRATAMIAGFMGAWASRSSVQRDEAARRYLRDQQRLRRLPKRLREATGRT